jgi:hypothetical protein
MRERFFEQGARVNKKVEAMDRELSDAGISDPSEWRKAIDLETPLEGEEGFKRHAEEIRQVESRIEVKAGKIEDANWQNQLDSAFEQGDYSLIKTLQRVRPDSIPNPHLVKNRLHELITSRPSGWVEDLKKIRSVVNIEADPSILSAEFGKLLDQFGQENEILDQLKTFKKATGYNPDPEIVQDRYRSILAGKKSHSFDTEDLFKDIKNLTGVNPDNSIFNEVLTQDNISHVKKIAALFGVEITGDMIQRAYEDAFAKNGRLDTYRIAEIGEKPNADLVQRAYQKIIEWRNDYWIEEIQKLKQVTGIEPAFSEEQIRPFLEKGLTRGLYDYVKRIVELTGIKPDISSSQARALKVIDDEHGYIDQGKRIKEGLKHLSDSVGVEFEIPESEIQSRYQQAIANRKSHIIINLYGAFEIKPSIDRETARQFMVSLMDETYHNPIEELEKVLGVKFKATPEEIEAKQDENLEKFNFDNLAKIKELTGKDVDRQKLETAIARWLEKEATIPIDKRGSYDSDWEKKIKQRLDQFGMVISPEVATKIYTALVQNEALHSNNLTKVLQLTGVPLPEGLAQQAYQKFLSPNYGYTVKTGEGPYRGLGSVSSAFEELFKVSGVKPEISNSQLQDFYRSCLGEDSFYGRGIHSIQKIAEITGVKPEFDPNDINGLYKQLVLSGREDRIRSIREATGIDLQLDEETVAHISQQIEAGIEKVRSGDYEEEEYREKKFDTYSLEQDLRKVGSLTAATGVQPNIERLQSTYSEILTSDPYWATKIEQIVKATGIKPVFSPEQLQAKGQQLLEQGSLRSFERLQAYGEFTFTPEVVAKTYDALLATNRRYDGYDWEHYYNEDWVDRIMRFKDTTGIAPTETQLAAIFSHLLQDGRFARRSYNRIGEAVDLLQVNFGATISEPMARDIYNELFVADNLRGIEELKKKIGLNPEVPTEVVREKCDGLLQKRDLDTLKTIKNLLNLDSLPLTPEIIQGEYKKLFDNPNFGTYSDEDIEVMYSLYDLTQVRPEIPQEQISRAYRQVMYASYDASYEKFEKVVGVPPSEEDLQNRVFNWLLDDYVDGKKDQVAKFITKHGISISEDTVTRAVERQLEEISMGDHFGCFYTNVKKITELSGITASISPERFSSIFGKIVEAQKVDSYSHNGILKVLRWFEEYTGSKPPQELVEKIYTLTFGKSLYGFKKQDGSDYKNCWEWLRDTYGLPSRETVQKIYLQQLASA